MVLVNNFLRIIQSRPKITFLKTHFVLLVHDMPYSQDEEYCTQPAAPANGRYSCGRSKNKAIGNDIKTNKMFAPGSICRVKCNKSYSIPIHLSYPFSIIQCTNGAWNMTDIEVCYINAQNPLRLLKRTHSHF